MAHREGCFVCGAFPNNQDNNAHKLYCCDNCGHFVCSKHAGPGFLKQCRKCGQKNTLKVVMTSVYVKKSAKGGLPAGAVKKGKRFRKRGELGYDQGSGRGAAPKSVHVIRTVDKVSDGSGSGGGNFGGGDDDYGGGAGAGVNQTAAEKIPPKVTRGDAEKAVRDGKGINNDKKGDNMVIHERVQKVFRNLSELAGMGGKTEEQKKADALADQIYGQQASSEQRPGGGDGSLGGGPGASERGGGSGGKNLDNVIGQFGAAVELLNKVANHLLDLEEKFDNPEYTGNAKQQHFADSIFICGNKEGLEKLVDVYENDEQVAYSFLSIVCMNAKDVNAAKELISAIRRVPALYGTLGYPAKALLDEDNPPNLKALRKAFANNPKLTAVGITGLEFSDVTDNHDQQLALFKNQLLMGHELNRPVFFTCKNAGKEAVNLFVELKEKNKLPRLIFCGADIDGPLGEYILKNDVFTAVRPEVTYPEYKLYQKFVSKLNWEQMLICSGNEFSTPVPGRGKWNEPIFIKDTAKGISIIKDAPSEAILFQTSRNFLDVFYGQYEEKENKEQK